MARDSKFLLKLQAKLDLTKASVNNINEDIKKLEGAINHIKLKVTLDNDEIVKIQKQISNIQMATGNNVPVNMLGADRNVGGSLNIIQAITQELKEQGAIVDRIRDTQIYVDGVQGKVKAKLVEATDMYGRQLQYIARIGEKSGELEIKQKSTVENLKRQREEEQKIASFKMKSNQQIQDILERNKNITEQELENLVKIHTQIESVSRNNPDYKMETEQLKTRLRLLDNTITASSKLVDKEEERLAKAKESLQTYKLQFAEQVKGLKTRSGEHNIPVEQMQQLAMLQERVNGLQVDKNGKVNEEIDLIRTQYNELSKNIGVSVRQNKAEEKSLQQQREMLEIFKRQSLEKIKGMKERNAKYITKAELDNLNRLQRIIEGLTVKTPQLNQQIAQLKTRLSETNKTFIASQKGAIGFGKAMKTALEKFSIWIGASTLFFQTFRFFRNGITYVNELNKALTEISVVTGMTQKEVTDLGFQYQKMAKDMGVLTTEITAGSVEFYRQGLSTVDVMKRMETTIKASKIAGVEFTQMAETLTATVNSMGVDIDRASDVFAYLGDATATSYEEVATAFQKVGGTAGALGVEFEKVASWIAVVSSRTRESAESIGTSFKTIIARMSNLTANGFDEEDGTKINDVAVALDKVGMSLTNADGSFRDFGVIIDELGGKWDGLDKKTKAYLGTTLAGIRQQSRFLNLMEGYSEATELYESSLESAGTTQEKYNLWLEGTEAKLNKLRTTATGVWQQAFDSETIRGFIGLITSVVSAFESLIKATGIFPSALTAIIPIVMLFNKQIRGAYTNFNLFKTSTYGAIGGLGRFSQALKYNQALAQMHTRSTGQAITKTQIYIATLKQLGVASAIAKAGLVALNMGLTLIIGIAIQKLIEGFIALTQMKQKAIEKTRELRREYDDATNTFSSNIKSLRGLADEYESLANKTRLSSDEQKRYNELSNQIANISPSVVKGYDEEGNAILDKKMKVEELIEALKEQQSLERKTFIRNSFQDYDKYLAEAKEQEQKMARLKSEINTLQSGGFDPNQASNHSGGGYIQGIDSLKARLKELTKEGREGTEEWVRTNRQIKEAESRIASLQVDMQNLGNEEGEHGLTMQRAFKELVIESEGYNEVLNELKTNAFETAEEIRKKELTEEEARQEVAKHVKMLADFSKSLEGNQGAIKKYDKALASFMENGDAKEFNKVVQGLIGDFAKLDKFPHDILSKYFKDADAVIEGFPAMEEVSSKLTSEIESLTEKLVDLEKIEKKVKDGHTLSIEEKNELIKKHPELEDAIYRTAKGWKVEKTAIDNLRKSYIKQAIDMKEAEISKTQIALNHTKTRISNITKEIESVRNLADAYKLAGKLGRDMGMSVKEGLTDSYEDYLALNGLNASDVPKYPSFTNPMPEGIMTRGQYDLAKQAQQQIVQYGKDVAEFDKLVSDTEKQLAELSDGKGLTGDSGKGGGKKDDKAKYDPILKYANAIAELENNIKKLQNTQDITTSESKRVELMKKELTLLELQQDAVHDMANKYREIREELVEKLKKEGFTFTGEGDEMMISNLSHIEGKGKDVKELYDEFIAIQVTEIPKASEKWYNLQKAIMSVNDGVMDFELDKVLKSTDSSLENVNNLMEQLDHKLSLLSDNPKAQLEILDQQAKLNQKIVEIAKREIEVLKEKKKQYAGNEEVVEELNQKLKEMADIQLQAEADMASQIKEQYDIMYSAIESTESRIVDMIRKRNELEREEFDKTHEEKIKGYDKDLEEYRDYINGKVKALDDAYKEEDYKKDLSKAQEELKEIQAEMNKLSLDNSLASRNRLQELAKQYADKESEIEEMKLDKSREDRKDNYKEQLSDYEDTIDTLKDVQEKWYKDESEKMKKRHSDAKVYAEARAIIETQSLEDIEKQLIEHENEWGRGMSIIGDSIKTNIIDNLKIVEDMLGRGILDEVANGSYLGQQMDGLNESRKLPWGMSYSDFATYVGNKQEAHKMFDEGKSWAEIRETKYHTENKKLREQYGIEEDKSLEELLKIIQGYDKGGVADYTGLAMLHGTKQKSEVIFNSSDAKKLYELVRNLPQSPTSALNNLAKGIFQNIELHIDNLIRVDGNVDEKTVPALQKISDDAVDKIVKTLKKKGHGRRF